VNKASGANPGGGVTGAPDHNTAHVIPLFKSVDEPVENPVDKLWKTG
jgi:hypothetical protein